MARGIRNNNPLNIRRNTTAWQGLSPTQRDAAFFQFVAPEWGYRAAIKTLRAYQARYNLRTLSQMIGRWAPPSENDTAAYVRTVSNRATVLPNVPIDLSNKALVCRILEAMCFVENGVAGDMKTIERGFDLAGIESQIKQP